MATYENPLARDRDALDRGVRQRFSWRFGSMAQWFLRAFRPVEDPTLQPLEPPLAGPGEAVPEAITKPHQPRFPLRPRGYDRSAVDHYVAELEGELAALDRELAERMRPESADQVARELKRVGEQTSAVLIAAHQQREEILSAARAQAERCVSDARASASAITARCEARVRELEAQNQAAQGERDRLVEEVRVISSGLAAVADSAEGRPPTATS